MSCWTAHLNLKSWTLHFSTMDSTLEHDLNIKPVLPAWSVLTVRAVLHRHTHTHPRHTYQLVLAKWQHWASMAIRHCNIQPRIWVSCSGGSVWIFSNCQPIFAQSLRVSPSMLSVCLYVFFYDCFKLPHTCINNSNKLHKCCKMFNTSKEINNTFSSRCSHITSSPFKVNWILLFFCT